MYRRHLIISLLCFTALLFSCKTQIHNTDTQVSYTHIDEKAPEDPELASFIAPFRAEMAKEMDVVIGNLEEDLIKSKPNSNLGNWFADILLDEANKMFYQEVDIAIQNQGGFRLPGISKGPLTVGRIYELMPFDNMLVVLDIPGPIFQEFLDGIARYGGWPISRSLTFRINEERKADQILVNDIPFHIDSTYRVALPDYVANGGDSAKYLSELPQENSGVFVRDVITVHLEELLENGEKIMVDSSIRIK